MLRPCLKDSGKKSGCSAYVAEGTSFSPGRTSTSTISKVLNARFRTVFRVVLAMGGHLLDRWSHRLGKLLQLLHRPQGQECHRRTAPHSLIVSQIPVISSCPEARNCTAKSRNRRNSLSTQVSTLMIGCFIPTFPRSHTALAAKKRARTSGDSSPTIHNVMSGAL